MQIEEFLDRVSPEPNSGCWLWIGSGNRYGFFKKIGAHRASWILHNGKIPEGMSILHKCDTPLCVNPNHLFVGTQKENISDRDTKGRRGRCKVFEHGEGHPNSKLSSVQINEIRSMAGIISARKIAKIYGVSGSNISLIIRRKSRALG